MPVCIYTDLGEILWRNALLDALLGYGETAPGRDSNMIWRMFTHPAGRARAPEEDWAHLAAVHVADLRATYSRRGGDADVTALVNDLIEASAEFRDLWQRHEVGVRRSDVKRFIHPEVGMIELHCEVMLTPDADLNLLAFFPLEGTNAAEKLELLRVIGTQDFRTTS